jgi:NTE family protein
MEKMAWPWWMVKPRLGVVLGGGAALGAFEVGVIDVMARAGIVPDLLVGTSVGAINAAFWALTPEPDVGERLFHLWMQSSRSTMFPDGPVPMVGRLFQRRDHLTTQEGLRRALERAIPDPPPIEGTRIPLAIIATDSNRAERVVIRRGPLVPAILASAAIPGLWPAVEIDGRRLVDGGLVSNCDVEAAVDEGMTDVLVVDVMGDVFPTHTMTVGQVLERAFAVTALHQTDVAIKAFGRGARIALLRATSIPKPGFADFSRTTALFRSGQLAGAEFLVRHLGPRRSLRPGVYEMSPPAPDTSARAASKAATA